MPEWGTGPPSRNPGKWARTPPPESCLGHQGRARPTCEHNDFIFRLLLFKHGKMKKDKRSLFWQLDSQLQDSHGLGFSPRVFVLLDLGYWLWVGGRGRRRGEAGEPGRRRG